MFKKVGNKTSTRESRQNSQHSAVQMPLVVPRRAVNRIGRLLCKHAQTRELLRAAHHMVARLEHGHIVPWRRGLPDRSGRRLLVCGARDSLREHRPTAQTRRRWLRRWIILNTQTGLFRSAHVETIHGRETTSSWAWCDHFGHGARAYWHFDSASVSTISDLFILF